MREGGALHQSRLLDAHHVTAVEQAAVVPHHQIAVVHFVAIHQRWVASCGKQQGQDSRVLFRAQALNFNQRGLIGIQGLAPCDGMRQHHRMACIRQAQHGVGFGRFLAEVHAINALDRKPGARGKSGSNDASAEFMGELRAPQIGLGD